MINNLVNVEITKAREAYEKIITTPPGKTVHHLTDEQFVLFFLTEKYRLELKALETECEKIHSPENEDSHPEDYSEIISKMSKVNQCKEALFNLFWASVENSIQKINKKGGYLLCKSGVVVEFENQAPEFPFRIGIIVIEE